MNYVQKLKAENADLQLRLDGAIEYLTEEIAMQRRLLSDQSKLENRKVGNRTVAKAKLDAFQSALQQLTE